MPKALSISGTVIAVLLLLIFGLDLAVKFPFDRQSLAIDLGMVLASVILGALSWMTFREQL